VKKNIACDKADPHFQIVEMFLFFMNTVKPLNLVDLLFGYVHYGLKFANIKGRQSLKYIYKE